MSNVDYGNFFGLNNLKLLNMEEIIFDLHKLLLVRKSKLYLYNCDINMTCIEYKPLFFTKGNYLICGNNNLGL